MRDHPHVGIEGLDRDARRLDLRHADAVVGVQDLALQIREVDDVVVDDAERSDAGRRQVERRRRAEAAGAEQQHFGGEQLCLSGLADLGKHEVAAVATELLGCELVILDERHAGVLPGREAAGHRHTFV